MLDEELTIMVVSTTCLEVPPEHYGGVEQMVYNISHELGKRGHNVTCVAPKGTEIEGVDVIETIEPDDSDNCFAKEPEAYEEYASYMPDCDVIVDHSWQKISYLGKADNPELMEDTEILGVWHGMPSVTEKPPVENANFVSVSKAAAKAWQEALGFEVRHVYNGIDMDRYPLVKEKEDYLMTLNRIMPEKGIKEVVEMANKMKEKFIIAGEDQFVDSPSYVHEVMEMCANSDYAQYYGAVDPQEKVELLSNAKGVALLPQDPYEEVFGLAATEAMACGTPVVCTDNNGLSEVVNQVQKWGVADDMDKVEKNLWLIKKGGRADLTPEKLRSRTANFFSKEKMADIYLRRIEQALQEGW